MHGGLFSEDGVTLEDLRKIDRNRQPPDSGRVQLKGPVTDGRNNVWNVQRVNIPCLPSQVPCVTSSGQIHSLRLVPSRSYERISLSSSDLNE